MKSDEREIIINSLIKPFLLHGAIVLLPLNPKMDASLRLCVVTSYECVSKV